MGSVKIVMVDDHPLFRAGVARSLFEFGGFEIVAEGSTYRDAVLFVERHRPDLLLLDITIPGGGLEAVDTVIAMYPEQKIVLLTASESGSDVSRALKSGARGYILKGVDAVALARILTEIAAGNAYVSPTLSARLLAGDKLGLDERQRGILALVSKGLSNKEIATELGLQEKSIKRLLTRIFLKLDVSNRTEAAIVFRDSGTMHQDSVSLSRG